METNNALPRWHHKTKRRGIMSEQPNEIKKLIAIASDMELSPELRTKAVELIGNIGSRDAFLALLDLAANEKLLVDERDLALKRAREIVKSGR
jgi:hypothetical protein